MFDIAHPYDLVMEVFAAAELSDVARSDLLNRYCGGNRLYHGLQHLATMWQVHDVLASANPLYGYLRRGEGQLAAALAFHDAEYDTALGSPENETRSAALWQRYGLIRGRGQGHADLDQQNWVADAILATADHLADRPYETDADALREWFVGLDLAAFAAPPDIVHLNNQLIRLEYRQFDDDAFFAGNGAFLRRLLDAPAIFRHPLLHATFEGPARANIETLLARAVFLT